MSAVWTPADLGSSLALWLDASDASTITLDGNRVVQWDDKSGNGLHATQEVSKLQPLYVADALNGQGVVRFVGNANQLLLPPLTELGSDAAMVSVQTPDDTTYILLKATGSQHSWTAAENVFVTGANVISANMGNPSYFLDGEAVVFQTRDEIFDATSDRTSIMVANDINVAGWSVTTSLGYYHGNSNYVGTYNYTGDIPELLLFSEVLAEADRQKVEGYLAHKWGLAENLPEDHPYKASAPMDGSICLAAGTLIGTPGAPVPIEALRPGDRVITRDHGAQPILWVGCQRVGPARLARAERLRPVRIAAGAMGPGTPSRELLVSQQHRMLLEGPEIARRFGVREVLSAARQLCGRPGIDIVLPAQGIVYHHLLFARHEVVQANGAWAESLFTGPWSMRLMGPAQRAEIFTLFPQLATPGAPPHAAPARRFLKGGEVRRVKTLVARDVCMPA